MEKRFVVGVPYTDCKHESEIPCACEEEAVAIAAGAWLGGRPNPLVFMQNAGFGRCIDIITSLLMPYEIDVEIYIKNRYKPDHHKYMGRITKALKKVLYAAGSSHKRYYVHDQG